MIVPIFCLSEMRCVARERQAAECCFAWWIHFPPKA